MGDKDKVEEDDVVDGCDSGDLKGISMASAKAREGKRRRRDFGEGELEGELSLLLSSEAMSSAGCWRECGRRKGKGEAERGVNVAKSGDSDACIA